MGSRGYSKMAHVPATNIRSAINIGQIMRQVIGSGKITRADELVFLRAMVAEDPLTSEDLTTLRQVMQRLDMGLIKVVKD
jgi:hypothetical protein